MASALPQEGLIPLHIQGLATPCHTYYKIIGDLSSKSPRLIVLHGGPGTGHEYLLPYSQLWEQYGIPVIFYDQIGCAASTHLPQTAGDESFWTESLFLTELNNLIETLKLRDGPGFHVLGHSWGGRIAAAFATTPPKGLRRLVLASGIASSKTWVESVKLLVRALPSDAQLAIEEGQQKGDFTSPEWGAAMNVFYRKNFCRVEPFPPQELIPAMKNMSSDTTVRHSIAGPSPLNCTGSCRDWTVIPRLHQINVPTLVFKGEYDTSHEVTTTPFLEHIPLVRGITFPDAGHMTHLEKPEISKKVFEAVGEFLMEYS